MYSEYIGIINYKYEQPELIQKKTSTSKHNLRSIQKSDRVSISSTTSTKILIAFNKLNNMTEVAHDNIRNLKLYANNRFHKLGFDRGKTSLNVSTERFVTIVFGPLVQLKYYSIVQGKHDNYCLCRVL